MSSPSTKPYAAKRALDLLVAGTACAALAPLVAGIAVNMRVGRWLRRTERWLKAATRQS